MKTLRYLIVGSVTGGGIGAKLGSYRATVQNVPAEWSWIKAGLVYGSLLGLTITVGIMVAFSLSSQRSEDSPWILQKSLKSLQVSSRINQTAKK